MGLKGKGLMWNKREVLQEAVQGQKEVIWELQETKGTGQADSLML